VPTAFDDKTLYEEAEAENTRLRAIIRWCAPQLPTERLPELQAKFDDATVPDATDDLEADVQRAQRLALRLAALVEPVLQTRRVPKGWDEKVEALLEEVRGFEPKNPILRPLPGALGPRPTPAAG
jgi:hypothetical protein